MNETTPARETQESLSLRAEAIIRCKIVEGEFAFGMRLSDRTLALTLDISRTPVREALARLANEGLVVIRPQSGTFVMTPTPASIREISEMRGVLECGALRIAAAKHPERLVAAVAVPLSGGALAVEEGELARATQMDSAFHNALVAAAENQLLTSAYRSIADRVEALRRRIPNDMERMRRAVMQHRRIIDLAVTGRIPQAEAELAGHVQIVQSLAVDLMRTLEKGAARRRHDAEVS